MVIIKEKQVMSNAVPHHLLPMPEAPSQTQLCPFWVTASSLYTGNDIP